MTPALVAEAVADAHRREWAAVLAATVRVTGDFDVAEECAQDAYVAAVEQWARSGVPASPGGWLTTVAKRRAYDRLRREATLQRKLPLLLDDAPTDGETPGGTDVEDDRLRLVFTCCHPALGVEARVALTLRLVAGLSTAEVARAVLVPEATAAARITRAKKKIVAARIPYRTPARAELPERLDGVLTVVHLVFTAGHTAAGAELVRSDLVDRAVHLARTLRVLLPQQPEAAGLLALVLLTDARRAARVDAAGDLVLLEAQDRSRWDAAAIQEGRALVPAALAAARRAGRAPGRFTLQAAIAAEHAAAPSWAATRWDSVVGWYDALLAAWPSPVVGLNRAIAVAMADGPAAGLALLDGLTDDPRLARYPYLPAARADLLRRLGRHAEATAAYRAAAALTASDVERRFLAVRAARSDAARDQEAG